MIREPENHNTKIAAIDRSAIFEGLCVDARKDLAALAALKHYAKNEIVFHSDEPCKAFFLVASGMIRVSRYSPLGKRITYLLAGPGEPINLVGPFTGAPREYIAEAARDSEVVSIEKERFTGFAFAHPQLIVNIVNTLGQAIDSSNSRILDILDKKVVDRLKRVLHTLLKKYGPILNFTSVEIAELVGTTTETALRVLGDLRQNGVIEKSRGRIEILKPEALTDPECEAFWI